MDTKTQAILNQLVAQRNQAHDTVASLCGEIAARDEQIAALTEQVTALQKPIETEAPVGVDLKNSPAGLAALTQQVAALKMPDATSVKEPA